MKDPEPQGQGSQVVRIPGGLCWRGKPTTLLVCSEGRGFCPELGYEAYCGCRHKELSRACALGRQARDGSRRKD